MIQKIAERDRSKAKEWAGALKKKVELVELNARIFKSLREKEREKIELVVEAQKTLLNPSDLSLNQDLAFTLNIIESNKDIPVICKTTAPPSVYKRLHKQYSNIVHCPEFLTAANAHEDYINSPYCVIGGDEKYCEMARKFIEPHLNISHFEYVITDIKTAALYKYMMNSYLAAKVTFMNEFYKLAEAEGVKWNRVKEIAEFDTRIGRTHMAVPGPDGSYGWGGACFPKDLNAIIYEAKSLGVDFKRLEQIQDINKEHRNNG
jgi:UDPglucose 6-dehydrogenase